MLWIQITSGSNEPIYTQIINQVNQAIAKGQLGAGDKLPPVRKLAAELAVNPNTVARAYLELEQRGLVTTKMGSGTFIADPKHRDKDIAHLNALTERFDNIICQALNSGFGQDQLKEIFAARLLKCRGHKEQNK